MNALENWSRPTERLMLAVLFAATLFAQWRTVAEHGVPVPFHDQWSAEVEGILEPWTRGELRAASFWKPSNEHRPVLTRVLAFAEFRLTGQWDTRLQMLLNGLLHACTAFALALLATRVFAGAGRLVAIVGIWVCVGASGSYENAVWGYQSQLYLMVLLGLLYLGGTFASARIDARWSVSQIAGALGLLAMAGGMLAPIAAAGLASARLAHRRDRHSVATLGSAVALALVGWWMLPATAGAGPLEVTSPMQFVDVLIKLLAWPSPFPLAAALMQLPWAIVALRLLAARDARPGDLLLTALGGWVLLQAAAIAYSRGGVFSEIPPRYHDILAVGLVVNAACLATVLRGGFRMVPLSLMAAAWVACGVSGWWHFNRPARVDPIVEAHEDLHRRTLEVVRDYIRTGDPAALTRDAFVEHHFPSIAMMRRLLDNPAIRESLPAEVRGEHSLQPAAQHAALAVGSAKWIGLASTILFAATLGFAVFVFVRQARTAAGPEPQLPWFSTAAGAAISALVLIAAGMRPWDTDPRQRVVRILEAAGEPAAGFDIPGAAGGIFALPETPQSLFFGTYLGGDAYTGEKVSVEFPIDRRTVIVPVTGYPSGPGNSLKLESYDAEGRPLGSAMYPGGDPGERIEPWSITVSSNVGQRARLVLVDGSAEWRGWLGVGVPRLTDDPDAARRMRNALNSIGAENARRLPAVLAALAAYSALAGFLARRAKRSTNLASAKTA